MKKLSEIIHKIYNDFVPLAEKSRVTFDLDYFDPTDQMTDEEIEADIREQLGLAVSRAKDSTITLSVKNGVVKITDTGTTISEPILKLLSHGRVSAKSRVGFGTTVSIDTTKHVV